MAEPDTSAANALYAEAVSLFQDGKEEATREKLEDCLNAQYDHAQAWLLKGQLLAKASSFNDAGIAYRRSAISGAADPAWQLSVAREFMRLGRFPVAITLTQMALTFGETVDGLCLLSELQAGIGQFQRARASAERALKIDPTNLLCQTLLANVVGNQKQRAHFTRDAVESGQSWRVNFAG